MTKLGILALAITLVAVFALGYFVTHIIVTKAMQSYEQPTNSLTTLEVKPNYGKQTEQGYSLQPAVTPMGKEL